MVLGRTGDRPSLVRDRTRRTRPGTGARASSAGDGEGPLVGGAVPRPFHSATGGLRRLTGSDHVVARSRRTKSPHELGRSGRAVRLGGVVWIRPAPVGGAVQPSRAGSGACSCKAEEGVDAVGAPPARARRELGGVGEGRQRGWGSPCSSGAESSGERVPDPAPRGKIQTTPPSTATVLVLIADQFQGLCPRCL
ncbi:hypothetical protein DKG34_25910 [Streptomyces sp. NWU49]|nr:hypothetical protein DKG34_25910 [Streptomyces sp. NWU49]